MRTFRLLFILSQLIIVQISTWGQTTITVGASGADYTTIETAYGAGIPSEISGAYIIELQTDYNPASESFPITLSQKTGTSSSNTITIRPAASVTSAFNITANITSQVFTLNGADWLIIDGRPGGTGTNNYITIENTSTNNNLNTNAIQFINDATNNVIRYCTVKGSVTNGTQGSGAISFYTTNSTNGNDNNTIQYCDLTGGSSGRPFAMIGANGTSGKENDGNIIEYNHFYDHFVAGASSNGIAIGQYNNGFIIRNNSFYETTAFTPTGNYTYIHVSIGGTASSNGHIVSNNYFGGKSAECGGAAMEIDGGTTPVGAVYRAITVNAGTVTATSIQNNIIRNTSIKSNSASCFGAIYVTGGAVNIGTETGNVIGSGTDNGSIYITSYNTSSNTAYGIYLSGAGTLAVSNNTVGSITAVNNTPTTESIGLVGIYCAGTGTITISDNIIGSTSTANSIWAASTPTGTDVTRLFGIWLAGATPAVATVSGNTISNLRNDYAGTTANCGTYGIGAQSTGNYTISNNTISYLYNANGSTLNNEQGSIVGVFNVATGSSGTAGQNITGNKIHNLYNTHANAAIQPVGIYFKGLADGKDYITNIANNYIYSIFKSSSSASSAIIGIHLDNNTTSTTYNIYRNVCNNIISLGTGEDDNCFIYGIYESNTAAKRNNLYFNTVYIGGGPNGNTNTMALYIAGTSGSNQRDIRNNIFVNARSRTGGTGKHYAAYFNNTSGLTVNYNDYYAAGTGGTLGYYSGDKTTLPIVTGQDANSLNTDPGFANAGGTNAIDYIPSTNNLNGAPISGYDFDYFGVDRDNINPKMGALEGGSVVWTGATNSSWKTAANWSGGVVPNAGAHILISGSLSNYPEVDQNTQTGDLTIASGASLTILPGYGLTIQGTFTNNAGNQGLLIKSDATGTGSLIEYNGVNATVERYISEDKWHYISSPVDNPTANVFLGLYMIKWDEPSGTWTYITDPNFSMATDLEGYGIWSESSLTGNTTVSFAGSLNTGTKSINLTKTSSASHNSKGFNFTGNPYPSSVDWDIEDGNGWTRTSGNVAMALYIYNPNVLNYGVYVKGFGGVGTNGVNNIIAPHQGFFVECTAATGFLGLDNGARIHSSKDILKSKEIQMDLLKLKVEGNGYADEVIFRLDPFASIGHDSYDAIKFRGEPVSPQLYSMSSDNYELSVNSFPLKDEYLVIPVLLEVGISGNYHLSSNYFEGFELPEEVYIEDLQTGIFTKITEGFNYSFYASPLDDINRFLLHLDGHLDIPEFEGSLSGVNIYSHNHDVYVVSDQNLYGAVYIYDMVGRKTDEFILHGKTMEKIKPASNNGYFIVQVVTGNGTLNSKVFLR